MGGGGGVRKVGEGGGKFNLCVRGGRSVEYQPVNVCVCGRGKEKEKKKEV